MKSSQVNPSKSSKMVRSAEPQAQPAAPSNQPKKQPPERLFPIVGVGGSAGGLEAFTQLLQALPSKSGMAFVIIQHLDPNHESVLASLLAKVSKMAVREAQSGTIVEVNCAYVIPPKMDLTVEGGVLNLVPRQENGGPHLPIDVFFRTLAETQAEQAVGVVLSGTGTDGALGLEAIHSQGGVALAQDPRSAKFDGMPRSAIATGCVDLVLTPQEIAKELVRIGRHPYTRGQPIAETQNVAGSWESGPLKQIFAILRNQKGVDFSYYKRNTIRRRIQRRMLLKKIEKPRDYLVFLQDNKAEVDELHNDLLIQVTRFFRDPAVFDYLKSHVFPEILRQKGPADPIRIWAAGCASGEELYSLAICLLEFLGEKATGLTIQMFGTDLSGIAVERARAGSYLPNIEIDVSPERLDRFFTKTDGRYQINKRIRDLCVFTKHNLLRDPPFAKLDLISCRNVLIYLETVLQKKSLSVFHFALNAAGWLVLGTSESVGPSSDLFSALDSKQGIYSVKASSSVQMHDFAIGRYAAELAGGPLSPRVRVPAPSAPQETARIPRGRDAPAGVIINENMEVLEFRGDTHPYLLNSPGQASYKLLRMARAGMVSGLAEALRHRKESPYRKSGLQVEYDGKIREVTIEVMPLKDPSSRDRHWAVMFIETKPPSPSSKEGPLRKRAQGGRNAIDRGGARWRLDLESTKAYLQSVVEEREALMEEMMSSNEEVLASNEELQTLNEELHTAKEELEASNEEITSVNEQLRRSNLETVSQMTDLNNLVDSTRVAIIMLGTDLRIRRFTPRAEKMLSLIPSDIGRLAGEIAPRMQVADLEKRIHEAVNTATVQEQTLQDKEGRWISLRIHPYLTGDKKIEGVLIVLMDVDDLKRSEIAISKMNAELEERVQKRTEQLTTANLELEAFSYSVAHDLRAPLRGSSGFAQVLLEEYGDRLDSNGRDYLQRICRASQRMGQLIDDLLSFSRLTRDKLRSEKIDLSELAAGIAAELEQSQPERQVHFAIAPGLEATGDERLLRIVLTNLLGNAWKFTSNRPAARIEFGSELNDGKKAFFVRDDGVGFDMAYVGKLFGVFKRLHAIDEFPGTGIGLAIVHRIIGRHGGTVWAQGAVDRGATFYFTLP